MKKIVKSVTSLLVIVVMISSVDVFAATGYEGYAIYTDGIYIPATNISVNWHSGIMYDRYISYSSLPVVHHGGKDTGGGVVSFASWNTFMGNAQFMGTYRPKAGISSSGRDNVKSMSARLASDRIAYVFDKQMEVNSSIYGSKVTVAPADITKMRCDGVVEYCYEYYGYRVYGNDSYWNISTASSTVHGHHGGLVNINPYKQATQYMTWAYGLPN